MQSQANNQFGNMLQGQKKDSTQNLENTSSPSPQLGGTIFTLKRGKTIFQQDTSFLMPIDPKKLNKKHIVEIQRPNQDSDHNNNPPFQTSKTGFSASRAKLLNKKKSEGLVSQLDESILTQSVKSGSMVKNSLRRSTVKLDETLQNYHRNLTKTSAKSPASAGVKGILKKAITVFGRKETTSPTPSPQTFNSRREKSSDGSRFSSHSSYISRYRRKFINQQRKKQSNNQVDVAKSKDLFKVLKEKAFKDSNVLPTENSDMAVFYLMDLDRIAKQSTLRSNSRTRKRKSQKHEKKSRRKHMNLRNFQRSSSLEVVQQNNDELAREGFQNNQYLIKRESVILDKIQKRQSFKKTASKINLFANTMMNQQPMNMQAPINIHRVNSVVSNLTSGINKSTFNASTVAVQSPQIREFKRRKTLFGGPLISKIEMSDSESASGRKSKDNLGDGDDMKLKDRRGSIQKKKTLHFRAKKFGETLGTTQNKRLQPRPTFSDNILHKKPTAMFGDKDDDSIKTDEDMKDYSPTKVQKQEAIDKAKQNMAKLRMKRQSTLAATKLKRTSFEYQLEEIRQQILEEKTKLRKELQVHKTMTKLKKSTKFRVQLPLNQIVKSEAQEAEDQKDAASLAVSGSSTFRRKGSCCSCHSNMIWRMFCLNENVFNDSDISSDDCEDNQIAFRMMNPIEQDEHLGKLWRSCYIKLKAGVHVLSIFSDLTRKIEMFGVSRGITDQEYEDNIPWYVIMPTDQFKGIWNVFTVFLLLYTAIVMPFKVSFTDQEDIFNTYLELVVDGLFFLDMIFTFFSAYEDLDNNIESRLSQIARNYLRSSFILDVVAIFPFQYVFQKNSYQKMIRLLRLPRLFRMLKILTILKEVKFLKQHKYFNKLMKNLSMNTAIIRMIQGMFASIVVTHFFACFFFLTSKFYDFEPDTWVTRLKVIDLEIFQQYLYSLYWATQTIVTLGYGDIPAVTSSEMIISLFWMIFGVGFYSFIIGNFSSIISGNIQIEATIMFKIKMLAELTKKAQIPLELSRKIKKFIENNFEAIYNQEDEAMLIKMLPPSLRDEVLSNTYGEVIEKIQFFRDLKDPDFLWKILPLLRPMKVEKGDIIYWRGDHADDLFFIMKGQIKLYTEKGFPYMKYQEGDLFGDSDTLLNLPRDGKAIAITHLKLMVLKVDQMFERTFENQEKNFMEMIFNARKKRNFHLRLIQKANQQSKKLKQMKSLMKERRASKFLGIGNLFGDSSNITITQDKSITMENPSVPTQVSGGLFGSFKNQLKKTVVSSLFKGEDSKFKSNRHAFDRMMQRKVQQQDQIEDQMFEGESPKFSLNPSMKGTPVRSQKHLKSPSKKSTDTELMISMGIDLKRKPKVSMFQKLSSGIVNKDGSMMLNPVAAAIESSMQNKIEGLQGKIQLRGLFSQSKVQSSSNVVIGFSEEMVSRNQTLMTLNSAGNLQIPLSKNDTVSSKLQKRKLSIIEEVAQPNKPAVKHSSSQALNSLSTEKRDPTKQSFSQGVENRSNSQGTKKSVSSNKGSSFVQKQLTVQSQQSGFFRNQRNSRNSKLQSKMSSLIDLNSLNMTNRKSAKHSVLNKVLASAFKDTDLSQIYEQYPFLKELEQDYDPSAQLAKQRSLKLLSANLDDMTPSERIHYLNTKIEQKFGIGGKLIQNKTQRTTARNKQSSSNQLEILPEINHSEVSSHIRQSDSSSVKSSRLQKVLPPQIESDPNILTIDQNAPSIGSARSSNKPKVQSLFAKAQLKQVKSQAIDEIEESKKS